MKFKNFFLSLLQSFWFFSFTFCCFFSSLYRKFCSKKRTFLYFFSFYQYNHNLRFKINESTETLGQESSSHYKANNKWFSLQINWIIEAYGKNFFFHSKISFYLLDFYFAFSILSVDHLKWVNIERKKRFLTSIFFYK